MDGMEYYPVEIQFRTISMDFWAAMEHRICYKSQPFNEIEMKNAFRQYSDILEKMEKSFEVYSENAAEIWVCRTETSDRTSPKSAGDNYWKRILREEDTGCGSAPGSKKN